jgi:hypothetical protein
VEVVSSVAIAICKTSAHVCVCDRDGRTPERSVPQCATCIKAALAAVCTLFPPGHYMRRGMRCKGESDAETLVIFNSRDSEALLIEKWFGGPAT